MPCGSARGLRVPDWLRQRAEITPERLAVIKQALQQVTTSPSGTALAENSSNKATGSGLDHSPSVQALYHPIEPEVARRTSASQLDSRTTACGPLA